MADTRDGSQLGVESKTSGQGLLDQINAIHQDYDFVKSIETRLPDDGVAGGIKDGAKGLQYGLHLLDVTRQAIFHAGLQDPIDGVTQLVNQVSSSVTGHKLLPEIHLIDAAEPAKFGTADWYAQTIGTGIGYIAPFLLTHGATSKIEAFAAGSKFASLAERVPMAAKILGRAELTAEEASAASRFIKPLQAAGESSNLSTRVAWNSVARSSLDGAIMGFVLTPSNDPNKNFWTQRCNSAMINALTFGTQGAVANAVAGGLERVGLSTADAALNSYAKTGLKIGVNALGGTAGGVMNAESSSILNGRGLATSEEVLQSVVAFTVTGGALDAVHAPVELLSRETKKAPTLDKIENRDHIDDAKSEQPAPQKLLVAPKEVKLLEAETESTRREGQPKSSSLIEMTSDRLTMFVEEAGDMTGMKNPKKIESFVKGLNDITSGAFSENQAAVDRAVTRVKECELEHTVTLKDAEAVKREFHNYLKTKMLLESDVVDLRPEQLSQYIKDHREEVGDFPKLEHKLQILDKAVTAKNSYIEACQELSSELDKRVAPVQELVNQFADENGFARVRLSTNPDIGQGGSYSHGVLSIEPSFLDGHHSAELAEFLYHETTHSAQDFLIASSIADDITGFDQLPRVEQQRTLAVELAKALGQEVDSLDWWRSQLTRQGVLEISQRLNLKDDAQLLNHLQEELPQYEYALKVIDARQRRNLSESDRASAMRLKESFKDLSQNPESTSNLMLNSALYEQAKQLVSELKGPNGNAVAREIIDDLAFNTNRSQYFQLFQVGINEPIYSRQRREGGPPSDTFKSYLMNSAKVSGLVDGRQEDPKAWHLEPEQEQNMATDVARELEQVMDQVDSVRKAEFLKYQETLHEMEAWANGTLIRQHY